MSSDNLGDRMKEYERAGTGKFLPLLPVCARIDGKTFSSWTRGLERPYDERLTHIMQGVTLRLVKETGACVGYTQSDEISLVWHSDSYKSQIFMDGKVQKMVSILSSMATAHFNEMVPEFITERAGRLAFFDCRVWVVPNLVEAANYLLWRERDATKNSVAMAAREEYSHKQLFKKNGTEMQEMLHAAGINWNDYPAFFKRGTWVQKRVIERPFSANEIDRLPPKHEAHNNPGLSVARTEYEIIDMPPFDKVTNKIEVIFRGAEPVTCSENITI